jgi:hypothetical protein
VAGPGDDRRAQRREGRAGDAGERPAAPDREGLRLGALLGAARHRVAADAGRLRLPPGVPDRAVRPRRQDRHPLRGHDAIQGQDFFFRKIVKDQAQALGHLAGEIEAFVTSEAGNGRLKVERALLATALEDGQAMVGDMITTLMSADESAEGGDIRNIYKVGLNTSRLLMALGDIVCAWLLLRGAEIALAKLGGEVSAKDKAFYEGKVAAAQFFARTNLPRLTAERAIAEATDLSLMDLDESSF